MNNETDVRQVMERTTTEDSAKIQEPERATGDGDAIDAEVLSLRSQLSTLTQERDALVKALKTRKVEALRDCVDTSRGEIRTNMDAARAAAFEEALALVDQGASK
jgi:hypothetical protein